MLAYSLAVSRPCFSRLPESRLFFRFFRSVDLHIFHRVMRRRYVALFFKLVSASRRASMMCCTFRISPHVDTASHAYMKSHVQSPMQGAKRQVSKIFVHTPMQKVPCLKSHVQRCVWSHMWGRALGTPHAYIFEMGTVLERGEGGR